MIACFCRGKPEMLQDLIYHGFMPATSDNTQTLFTLEVLDDARQTNLDCRSSSYSYHLKLQRKTNPSNPSAVPSTYTLLRRLSRQHRLMKRIKWSGVRLKSRSPKQGELALFCTACPQPGINLPKNFLDDPNR